MTQNNTVPEVSEVSNLEEELGQALSKRRSDIQAIINLVEDKRVRLTHDEHHESYAVIEDGEKRQVLRMDSRRFQRWLSRQYYKSTKKMRAASKENLQAAIDILEAEAFEAPPVKLHNRFAHLDGAVWLDLADDKHAVKVTPEGWEVVRHPPVLFRRLSHQLPLPLPERGGSLQLLRPFLNLSVADDWAILRAWIIAALLGEVARPILIFHGVQGSAKTTVARLLRSLVDPCGIYSLDMGQDRAEWAQALQHHAVPVLDNLGHLKNWQENLLCRAVTGGGYTKRALYSNDDDVLWSFRRAILITGINIPTVAPDLLDRALLINLERLSPDKRREENELWRDFEALKPKILGALLDALVGAMKHYPNIKPSNPVRMVDFYRWGAAISEALEPGGARAFEEAMARNVARQTEEVLEGDPLADAIQDLVMHRQGIWEGSPSELLNKLNSDDSHRRDKYWPANSAALGRRLRVLLATFIGLPSLR